MTQEHRPDNIGDENTWQTDLIDTARSVTGCMRIKGQAGNFAVLDLLRERYDDDIVRLIRKLGGSVCRHGALAAGLIASESDIPQAIADHLKKLNDEAQPIMIRLEEDTRSARLFSDWYSGSVAIPLLGRDKPDLRLIESLRLDFCMSGSSRGKIIEFAVERIAAVYEQTLKFEDTPKFWRMINRHGLGVGYVIDRAPETGLLDRLRDSSNPACVYLAMAATGGSGAEFVTPDGPGHMSYYIGTEYLRDYLRYKQHVSQLLHDETAASNLSFLTDSVWTRLLDLERTDPTAALIVRQMLYTLAVRRAGDARSLSFIDDMLNPESPQHKYLNLMKEQALADGYNIILFPYFRRGNTAGLTPELNIFLFELMRHADGHLSGEFTGTHAGLLDYSYRKAMDIRKRESKQAEPVTEEESSWAEDVLAVTDIVDYLLRSALLPSSERKMLRACLTAMDNPSWLDDMSGILSRYCDDPDTQQEDIFRKIQRIARPEPKMNDFLMNIFFPDAIYVSEIEQPEAGEFDIELAE